MNIIDRFGAGILLTLALGMASAGHGGRDLSAQTTPPAPCAAPAYHQFDFWIGDWDVFDTGGSTKVAHARIDSILGGCVLREDYHGADGHKGQSFTIYDASRNIWHQTWVTNRGELLEIEGQIRGRRHGAEGKESARRTGTRHLAPGPRRSPRIRRDLDGQRQDLEALVRSDVPASCQMNQHWTANS